MIISRRFMLVVVLAIAAVAAYLGVTHAHNASVRHKKQLLAAATSHAKAIAEQKAAAMMLSTVHLPTSFTSVSATKTPQCHPSADELCVLSTLKPSAAIAEAATAVRSAGLQPGTVSCAAPAGFNPTTFAKAFKGGWSPCHTTIAPRSDVTLNLAAFPSTAAQTASGSPTTFTGSFVSIAILRQAS